MGKPGPHKPELFLNWKSIFLLFRPSGLSKRVQVRCYWPVCKEFGLRVDWSPSASFSRTSNFLSLKGFALLAYCFPMQESSGSHLCRHVPCQLVVTQLQHCKKLDRHLSSATAGVNFPASPFPCREMLATFRCSLQATPTNEPLHGSPEAAHEDRHLFAGSKDDLISINALSSVFPAAGVWELFGYGVCLSCNAWMVFSLEDEQKRLASVFTVQCEKVVSYIGLWR
ncbi:phosphatidylinositol 4-OH kinase beta2, partial [Striga asiatica]